MFEPALSCTGRDNDEKGRCVMSVYKIVEVIGTSEKSWEAAAKEAVETASKSLRDLRIAEVDQMDMKLENGKVAAYRVKVRLSFKIQDD
jgi:flavin-binding protein dodecin